jgi:potassium-transporting ATPase KdpC subunit
MRRYVLCSIRMALVTLVLLGVVYPLAITGLAQLMPAQAGGSLIRVNGRPVGSRLIGQNFTSTKYFHPRPSAAGSGYDAAASAASNIAPTSKTYIEDVRARVASATAENAGLKAGEVPVDMVTASASGLDPDISVANALAQAQRVAQARGLAEASVRSLVESNVTGRQFGILGEPRVNVLELNLALDGVSYR